MADCSAIRVPLPLRADELTHLLLEQLPEHTQADLDRQGQQSFLRGARQLSQRLLHTIGQHGRIVGRLRDRYGLTHGGSSLDLGVIAHHAPTRSGRDGGTAVTSNFHERRDNLITHAPGRFFTNYDH